MRSMRGPCRRVLARDALSPPIELAHRHHSPSALAERLGRGQPFAGAAQGLLGLAQAFLGGLDAVPVARLWHASPAGQVLPILGLALIGRRARRTDTPDL
jgi:hypothetical protein